MPQITFVDQKIIILDIEEVIERWNLIQNRRKKTKIFPQIILWYEDCAPFKLYKLIYKQQKKIKR